MLIWKSIIILIAALISLNYSFIAWSQTEKESSCHVNKLLKIDSHKDLEAYIFQNSSRITSVTDLLNCLPDHYKNYFTLINHSHSAEAEDVHTTTPRVILFGEENGPILTFNTLPIDQALPTEEQAKHFNKIQIADSSSGSWVFKEYEFKNSKVEIRSDSCYKCHAEDKSKPHILKPLWGDYPLWKGVYGSVDDLFYVDNVSPDFEDIFEAANTRQWQDFFSGPLRQMNKTFEQLSNEEKQKLLTDHFKEEKKMYESLKASVSQNPRLKLLNFSRPKLPKKIHPTPTFEPYTALLEPVSFVARPNSFFTHVLLEQHLKTLVIRTLNHPKFKGDFRANVLVKLAQGDIEGGLKMLLPQVEIGTNEFSLFEPHKEKRLGVGINYEGVFTDSGNIFSSLLLSKSPEFQSFLRNESTENQLREFLTSNYKIPAKKLNNLCGEELIMRRTPMNFVNPPEYVQHQNLITEFDLEMFIEIMRSFSQYGFSRK
jgi:hypothetical protein